jgi:glutaredoxin
MGKIKLFIIAIIIAVILFGIWIFKQVTPSLPNTVTLYTSKTCPHCQVVDNFIQTQNIHNKLNFTEKQLESHTRYVRELVRVVRFCGYQTNQLPIPVLWTGQTQTCVVGEKDIIHYFNQQINPQQNQGTVTKIQRPRRTVANRNAMLQSATGK